MTLHNLTAIFEENLAENLKAKLKKKEIKSINPDDRTIQTTFLFGEKSPEIIFIQDKETLKSVEQYSDLPAISLNEQEKAIVNEVKLNIEKNGGYDGDQLLISDILYDDEKNAIYLKAVKVKYSLLRALSLNKLTSIDKISLYKIGVAIPQISKDENVVFMERKRDGFYYTVAGFLEAKNEKQSLGNLVLDTAKEELEEELFSDIDNIERDKFLKSLIKQLTLKGMSVRQTIGNSIKSIEFIVENQKNLDIDYLKYIIKNNQAKDRNEHTKDNLVVSLDSLNREITVNKLRTKKPSGWFLHSAVLDVLAGYSVTERVLKKPSSFVSVEALRHNPELNWIEHLKDEKNKLYYTEAFFKKIFH
jgi:hypothetical protein